MMSGMQLCLNQTMWHVALGHITINLAPLPTPILPFHHFIALNRIYLQFNDLYVFHGFVLGQY